VGTSDDVRPQVPVERTDGVSSSDSKSRGAASPTASIPAPSPGGRWNVSSPCGGSVLSTPSWSSRRDSVATVYLTCQSRSPELDGDCIEDEQQQDRATRALNGPSPVDSDLPTLTKSEKPGDLDELIKQWSRSELARSRARRVVMKTIEKIRLFDSATVGSRNDGCQPPRRLSFSCKKDD
jgi:hypothetical protein